MTQAQHMAYLAKNEKMPPKATHSPGLDNPQQHLQHAARKAGLQQESRQKKRDEEREKEKKGQKEGRKKKEGEKRKKKKKKERKGKRRKEE